MPVPKIQEIGAIPKTGIYILNLHTNSTIPNFESIALCFGCAMIKTGKGDDVTFFNEIIGISYWLT